jgi:hypothetical protein
MKRKARAVDFSEVCALVERFCAYAIDVSISAGSLNLSQASTKMLTLGNSI